MDGAVRQPSHALELSMIGTVARPTIWACGSGLEGGGMTADDIACTISKHPNQAAPPKAVPITTAGQAARRAAKVPTIIPLYSMPLPNPLAAALPAADAALPAADAALPAADAALPVVDVTLPVVDAVAGFMWNKSIRYEETARPWGCAALFTRARCSSACWLAACKSFVRVNRVK